VHTTTADTCLACVFGKISANLVWLVSPADRFLTGQFFADHFVDVTQSLIRTGIGEYVGEAPRPKHVKGT
jgi:hypothetical protein